ncbi:gliding motility-associated C-terminal domain-containing protein [Gramella lutea]|uniref:Gliding motility-associated C-terminal domain-containing protein n=1 Tax=Christiangramia lutea TaxID=1607951 RepID=A0A9X2A9L0_9FLAO|nr:MopE-related protein [Christiangramia lutea]MCH4822251.1 gliding motility-associated C-terminal domain-containing protein [Christiangramia lutea]
MKKFYQGGIFLILLLIACHNISAQTKGFIYKPASGAGESVLDPNMDGYTSETDLGFDLEDERESEIPYTPLPSLGAAEPDSDLGPGPNCSFTDLVKSEDNNTIYTYLDSNENLMFRFRLGGTAENSKAYSILIDTDQKFGSSGANADPNYMPGNPGFEIEVVLRTNFGVGLYDVDGTTNAVEIGNASTDRPYSDFAQKSIAHSEICGDDDYFYDFYIPFSDITAAFSSVTVNTPLRMVGNTVINPKESIGNNGISDLGGVDDTTGIIDDLWGQLIDVFPPTSVSEIGTGSTLPARAECPGITGPIDLGETSVSGTSSEVDGAIIEVFRDGISVGTTTVSSGGWTLNGISETTAGEKFTASAKVSVATAETTGTDEKSESYSDCNEIEVAVACSSAPTAISTSNGGKKFNGSGSASGEYTIRIYKADGTLLNGIDPNPDTYSGSSWVWTYGSGSNKIPPGAYYFTLKEVGKCESPKTEFCYSTSSTSLAPVVSGTPILESDSTISGTATADANVTLLVNGEEKGTVTATGGNWSFSVSDLVNGDELTFRSVETGSCKAETTVTVYGQSRAPIIQGDYCSSTGSISTISGISSEIGGTINIYSSSSSPVSSGTSIATATVAYNGSWTASVNIPVGNFVVATVTNTDELESELSNEIEIYDQTVDASLAITSDPINEGDASISGTGTSGNTIYLYLDGYIVDGYSAVVDSDGNWTISGLEEASAGYDILYSGAVTGVSAKEGAQCESGVVSGPTVQCKPPSSQGFSVLTSTDICENETISFQINPTEDLIVYELVDQDGNAISPSKLGDDSSAAINIETFGLSVDVSSVRVKALRVGVSCEVIFGPAISVNVDPLPEISLSETEFEICSGDTSFDLAYTLEANGPAVDYSIDFDSAAEAAGFVDVNNDTGVSSPISISIPEDLSEAIFSAVFTVRNSGSVLCTSASEAFTIKVFAPKITSVDSTNPTTCSGADGSFTIKGLLASESYDSLSFTDNGSSVNLGSFTSNASGEFEVTGLDAGSYENLRVEYNACLSEPYEDAVILTDPGSATISYAGQTDPTNCTSPDGEIVLSGVSSGDYTVNYNFGGSTITQSITASTGTIAISGLEPGDYTNISVTNSSSCTSNTLSGPISLANAGTPEISLGSNPEVSFGTTLTELAFAFTTNNPDQYSIDFDTDAESEGFVDVTNNTLPASPIKISLPADAAAGIYNASLQVRNSTTGCISSVYNFSITINENQAPEITNNGSAKTFEVDYAENGTGNVIDWDATDMEGDVLTFSLSGTDAGLFNLDSKTGVLTFKSSPNFEGTGDNEYEVTVTVSDGSLTDTQILTVNVTDVDDTYTFYADTDEDGFGDPSVSQVAETAPIGYVADNTDCDDTDEDEFPGQTWYLDADGDLYSEGTSTVSCTRPVDHYIASELTATSGDCDDIDDTINPGASEVPDNDIDENCDGVKTYTFFADIDGDGFGDPSVSQIAETAPTGYVAVNTDCDDSDEDEFPGQTWYLDADGDLYGEGTSTVSCTRPVDHFIASELTATSGDCDDADGTINPGASEVPDNDIDENCDGVKTYTFYADTDGDGFGNPSFSQIAETAPTGYVSDNTDCDDTDEDEFPGQTWYLDADGDLYGEGTSITSCTRPADHFIASELTATSGDCDDTDDTINPGATEIEGDGIDQDCDGSDLLIWYADTDGDGFGDASNSVTSSTKPTGYVSDNTDCDDTDEDEFPGQTWYLDADGDLYSDGTSTVSCTRPADHYIASELMATSGDCDDTDDTINPGASEVPDNDIDENCDGVKTYTFYADTDGDGFGDPSVSQIAETAPIGYAIDNTDCDDTDEDEFPGQTWYLDADGDLYGEGTSTISCTRPADHYIASELTATSGDCDDTDDTINPGASEVPDNDIDENCDGVKTYTYYADTDGDGFGDASNSVTSSTKPTGYVADNTDCDDSDEDEFPGQTWYLDADGDLYSDGTSTISCTRPTDHYIASELTATSGDCDDTDDTINPGATEIGGDGIDQDCDGSDLLIWYADTDGDGFGDPSVSQVAETAPIGYVADNTDCDDTDEDEFPGQTWYLDADGDLYSDGTSTVSCTRPTDHYIASELTATSGDCDDTDDTINPGASEIPDNDIDENCDGVKTYTFYADTDGDGFGNPSVSQIAETAPSGFVADNTDCDDTDEDEFPGQSWYLDADGDLYGEGTSTISCTRPADYFIASELTATSGDCDDTDDTINPGATEIEGDGIDQDCDGSDLLIWYADTDGDSFGDASNSVTSSTKPTGYVADNTDCDDTDEDEFPGQTWYLDADGDLYSDGTSTVSCTRPVDHFIASELTATLGDCDDADDTINPGASEVPDNDIDENCDGVKTYTFYADTDGDGFGDASVSQRAETVPTGYVADNTDCDDTDEDEFPGQTWYLDADGDLYGEGTSTISCTRPADHYIASELTATSGDCDDTDDTINPGATEIEGDGIDQDCDGSDLLIWYADTDGDGFGDASNSVTSSTKPTGYVADNTDCDDTDEDEFPGQTWYLDADGDLYGEGTSTVSCTRPVDHFIASELTATSGDCDDTDDTINPGASEVPNNDIDENCDGVKTYTFYADTDGDGFGDPSVSQVAETVPTGYVADNTDCDDTDEDEFPGQTWYLDADGDLYGEGTSKISCTRPADHYIASELTATSGDCDDTADMINPGASEVPDNDIDENCDGVKTYTFYADTDGDGFGDASVSQIAETAPSGYVADNTDCDDSDEDEFPGQTWYLDADGDLYGEGTSTISCTRPADHFIASELTATSGDCDDSDDAINPDTIWYLGVDADDDGFIGSVTSETQCTSPGSDYSLTEPTITDCADTDKAITPETVWYKGIDTDSDGYFGSVESVTSCESPGAEYALTSPGTDDCNDSDENINPETIWYLGVDADDDGFIGSVTSETQCTSPGSDYSLTEPAITDCADTDKTINPDTMWYKGIDADSDGYFGSVESVTSCESPGAEYALTSPIIDDCDDSDDAINPDTVWYLGVDADGDGFIGSVTSEIQCNFPGTDYSLTEPAITDCADTDKTINPDTMWYKGIDADSDGYFGSVESVTSCESPGTEYALTSPATDDCDDSDDTINPGATEIPDNDIDENCDGIKEKTTVSDIEAVYSVEPARELDEYLDGDLIATVIDADGAIVAAEITAGSMPAGMVMNSDGSFEIEDANLLEAGEFSVEITTTDEKGGITIQTILITILGDSDLDNDGLSNEEEVILGTDPENPDSDGDGLTDGEEVLVVDDPITDAGPTVVSDPLNECDPFQTGDNCDPDNDGLTNAEETQAGTNPNDPDSDNDGLTDGEEINGIDDIVTPTVAEGISDPLDPCDPNRISSDCYDNGPEVIQKLSPNGDGIHDYFEITGIETFEANTLEIFNRWGVLVYEAEEYGDSNKLFRGVSEGRLTVRKGEELPAGTYFYVLRYKDGEWKSKSGYLYLNR